MRPFKGRAFNCSVWIVVAASVRVASTTEAVDVTITLSETESSCIRKSTDGLEPMSRRTLSRTPGLKPGSDALTLYMPVGRLMIW